MVKVRTPIAFSNERHGETWVSLLFLFPYFSCFVPVPSMILSQPLDP
jgi:hypothetical protein